MSRNIFLLLAGIIFLLNVWLVSCQPALEPPAAPLATLTVAPTATPENFNGPLRTASPSAIHLLDESVLTTEHQALPSIRLSPPARAFHQMVYDERRTVLVMVGGVPFLSHQLTTKEEKYPEYFSDTWEFDGQTWKEVKTLVFPEGRIGHTMAYYTNRGVTVLYGGQNASQEVMADTWEYDGIMWQLNSEHARTPGTRLFPRTVYDPREWGAIILIAGLTLGDVWQYKEQSWELLLEFIPPPLRLPLATQIVFDKNREVFVFTNATGETYEVDRFHSDRMVIDFNDIRIATPRVEIGGSRSDFSLIYDTKRSVTVLFGGQRFYRPEGSLSGERVDVLNDTWEYDGKSWHQVETWQSPPGRYLHAAAYDEARGVTVLFGGVDTDGNALNDTWEYDGVTWKQK